MEEVAAAAALIAIAAGTTYFASVNAASKEHLQDDPEQVELTAPFAAMAAVVASFVLVGLFFFFQSLSFLLLVGASLGAVSALMLVFRSLLARWPLALQAVLAVGLVLAWLVSGHWLLNNILACALACFITATVRLPNARVGAVLLCGLFVYDIFWVFFSSAFFGQNVMVSVANNQASNPVAGAAQALRIPSSFISATLELPAKLLVPVGLHGGFVGLGLGDVVMPGLLLCQLCRASKEAQAPRIFSASMISYVLGLIIAFVVTLATNSPQPALLYIVPCVLVTSLSVARASGVFSHVWNGSASDGPQKPSMA